MSIPGVSSAGAAPLPDKPTGEIATPASAEEAMFESPEVKDDTKIKIPPKTKKDNAKKYFETESPRYIVGHQPDAMTFITGILNGEFVYGTKVRIYLKPNQSAMDAVSKLNLNAADCEGLDPNAVGDKTRKQFFSVSVDSISKATGISPEVVKHTLGMK